MGLLFRRAKKKDTEFCVDLILSSAPELFRYVFLGNDEWARQYIAYEFCRGWGFHGHTIHTIVESSGDVAGVGAFYSRNAYSRLVIGSLLSVFLCFGMTKGREILRKDRHCGSILEKPRKGSVYIANLGVHPEKKRQGIATALIRHEIEKAKAAGFSEMSLDVVSHNKPALALYHRLGFTVIKDKRFIGDDGNNVPEVRLMALQLR